MTYGPMTTWLFLAELVNSGNLSSQFALITRYGKMLPYLSLLYLREIKRRLTNEVRDFIRQLNISRPDKEQLLRYYDQVWHLVTSGEIKLELDLHFSIEGIRYVVDCKSGFGSNEKGNTNRLLLVASIYQHIEPEEYRCLLLVRAPED